MELEVRCDECGGELICYVKNNILFVKACLGCDTYKWQDACEQGLVDAEKED